MTAPSVLLVPRELDFVASDLEDVYNLLRLWDDPPADELAHARVLVCLGHQSPEALIARMPRLELIACYKTGYDAVRSEEHTAELKSLMRHTYSVLFLKNT